MLCLKHSFAIPLTIHDKPWTSLFKIGDPIVFSGLIYLYFVIPNNPTNSFPNFLTSCFFT